MIEREEQMNKKRRKSWGRRYASLVKTTGSTVENSNSLRITTLKRRPHANHMLFSMLRIKNSTVNCELETYQFKNFALVGLSCTVL
jgi:hypothetical protein